MSKLFIEMLDLQDYEFVNPDLYAAHYFDYVLDDKERYIKAFKYAQEKIDLLIKNQADFILETVNSTDKYESLYRRCQDAGYKITVVFVCTSNPSINIKRVERRVKEGGHDVSKDKTIERYYKSLNNLFKLAERANYLYIFDNSRDEMPARLCVHKDEKQTTIFDNSIEWINKYYLNKKANNPN